MLVVGSIAAGVGGIVFDWPDRWMNRLAEFITNNIDVESETIIVGADGVLEERPRETVDFFGVDVIPITTKVLKDANCYRGYLNLKELVRGYYYFAGDYFVILEQCSKKFCSGVLYAPGISVNITTSFDFDKVYRFFKDIKERYGVNVSGSVSKSYGSYYIGENVFVINKKTLRSLYR